MNRVADRQILEARQTLWRYNNGYVVTEDELARALSHALTALEEARR